MLSKDDWNESCAVYQSLSESLKIQNYLQMHQNFNNFIYVNWGLSAQVFWPETLLCKGGFLVEMKVNPNFCQLLFKTFNLHIEITVRRVSRWCIYIEILIKLGSFYCTYTLIPIFWKVLGIYNKEFGLFYLFIKLLRNYLASCCSYLVFCCPYVLTQSLRFSYSLASTLFSL